jgi:hypothetical protein
MMGRVFKKERLVKELLIIILPLVINPVVLLLYLQLEMTLI